MSIMASYQEQHAEVQQKGKRDKPSPLRIVKRRRSLGNDHDSRANTSASINDSDSNISNITARTKYLEVFQRRLQQPDPTVHNFWASSVDLRHPQTRSWEDAISRCRGLLRKSTPNIRTYKRYLTVGRSRSSQTESSGRLSSACSSQRRTSTECYRASSTSSNEAESQNLDRGSLQRRYCSSHTFQPQTPRISSNQLSPRQISQNTKTYILSPRIVMTPQQKELNGSEGSVWVAVEISRTLSRISPAKIPVANETPNGIVAGTYIDHKIDRFFDFGCLYNLTVEVSAVPGTAILDVVHEQSWPTTVYAGTSVLIVVHIQLPAPTTRSEAGHSRSTSDELMEELELQLGNVQTQLMNIRVLYHHSAFPEISNVESLQDGLSHLQSRTGTTATAAIARRSSSSFWPSRCKASQNSLFPLMVQHWGDEKAICIQRRISDSLANETEIDDGDILPAGFAVNGGSKSFDFNVASTYSARGFQSYYLHESSPDPSAPGWPSGTRAAQLLEHAQESTPSTNIPGRGIYYFGERALRTLAPASPPEKHTIQTRTSTSQRLNLGPKHKDSRSWGWGSWF